MRLPGLMGSQQPDADAGPVTAMISGYRPDA